MTVQDLPTRVEFFVVVRVVGQPEEFVEEPPPWIEMHVDGPNMDWLKSLEFEIQPVEPSPDHPGGWELGRNIPVMVLFTAREEGAYMLHFRVCGREQASFIPLRILLGSDRSERAGTTT